MTKVRSSTRDCVAEISSLGRPRLDRAYMLIAEQLCEATCFIDLENVQQVHNKVFGRLEAQLSLLGQLCVLLE